MLQRWLVVIIGLPLLLAAFLLCPSWVTLIVVCGIAAAAAYELLHTAGKKVPKCVYAFTILAAVAQEWVIYDAHTWQFYDSYQSVGMIRILCVPLALVTALFFVAVKGYGTPNAMPFADVAAAMMGGTVFPMMYSAIFLLRMDGLYGKMYVLLPFCVAFLGDSFAMYGGMLFGKRKMAPAVSPHKTWAGSVAGLIGSALGLVLWGVVARMWLGYEPNYLNLVLAGLVTNAIGQLGDLAMSREKAYRPFRHLPVLAGCRGQSARAPAADRVRRAVPHMDARTDAERDARAGAQAPELVNGRENHHRLGEHVQQGAGNYRGALAVPGLHPSGLLEKIRDLSRRCFHEFPDGTADRGDPVQQCRDLLCGRDHRPCPGGIPDRGKRFTGRGSDL